MADVILPGANGVPVPKDIPVERRLNSERNVLYVGSDFYTGKGIDVNLTAICS